MQAIFILVMPVYHFLLQIVLQKPEAFVLSLFKLNNNKRTSVLSKNALLLFK